MARRHDARRQPGEACRMIRLACALVASGVLAFWALWREPVLAHGSLTTTVVFEREIVALLNDRCVACHAAGGPAFPLETYEQTWLRREAIRAAVLRRHMPPWPAVAGYGQFANDNSLTLRETHFLVSWVDGLAPRGAGRVFLNVVDPRAAAPEVRAVSHAGHWMGGRPDLERPVVGARVAAREPDRVSRTAVDLGLTSTRLLRALEYMPADRRVVRAAVFTLEATGQWLGSWTPWYGVVQLPSGAAHRLPARSRIVAEIHYRGAGEPVIDRGTLGLHFTNDRAARSSPDLVLVANDSGRPTPPDLLASGARKRRATTRLAADTRVWALWPDVVPGLRSIEVSARQPDGTTEILLFARDLSTEWPTPFILKEPRLLPRGTELTLAAHVDGIAAPRSVRLRVSRY
jgi:hypothetical protein